MVILFFALSIDLLMLYNLFINFIILQNIPQHIQKFFNFEYFHLMDLGIGYIKESLELDSLGRFGSSRKILQLFQRIPKGPNVNDQRPTINEISIITPN